MANVTVDFTKPNSWATDPLGAGMVCSEFNNVPLVNNATFKANIAKLSLGHIRFSTAWYNGAPNCGAGGSQGAGGPGATALINAVKSTGALPLVSFNGNSSDNGYTAADAGSMVHYFNDNGGQNGGSAKYWTIGNEPGTTAGQQAAITAMLGADPTVIISAPGAAFWNTSLLQSAVTMSGVGILSYHAYDGNDAAGSDNGHGGYNDTLEYFNQTGQMRGMKAGILYGVEEFGWNSSTSTSQGPNNSYKGGMYAADVMGELLSSGAHGSIYSDQNGGLGIISDGGDGNASGTLKPPYWGVGIWTGMQGQFARYSSHFVATSCTIAHTSVEIYACDNGKIVAINKDAVSYALSISVTLAGGVSSGTYNVSATGGVNNAFGAITTTKGLAFTNGTINYTLPAGTATSIDVTGITGGSGTGGSGTTVSGSLNSANGQFQTAAVGPYLFQLNEWGTNAPYVCSYSYTATNNPPSSGFQTTSSSVNVGTGGAPGTYSSIISGRHVVGGGGGYSSSVSSQLPIQNSKVTAGQITCSVTGTIVSAGAWDFAFDNWFSTQATPASVSNNGSGLEMMIWLNHFGGIQPAGSNTGNATIGGVSYAVWIGTGGPISYVRNTPVTSVTDLDMFPFIQDAISRGMMTSSWFFIDIEMGNEIWVGGTGLGITSFSTTNGNTGITPPPGNVTIIDSDSGSGTDAQQPVTGTGNQLVGFANGTGASISLPLNWGTKFVAPGSAAVVVLSLSAATTVSVSDTPGNAYSLAASSTSGGTALYIYSASSVSSLSGAAKVTVTLGASVSYAAGLYALPSATVKDVSATATGSSTAPSVAAGAESTAGDLEFTVFADSGANTNSTPAGWSSSANLGTGPFANTYWRTSSGLPGDTCTSSYAATQSWAAVGVAFKTQAIVISVSDSDSASLLDSGRPAIVGGGGSTSALLVNDFLEGTNGTTLTQGSGGNTAGAGENFFDSVVIGAGNTVAFSNTQAHPAPGLSAKVQTSAGGGVAYFGWSTSLGTQTAAYGRAYLNLTAYPATSDAVISHYSGGAGGTQVFGIQVTQASGGGIPNGVLNIQNSAGVYLHQFASIIPLNTWVRVEYFINCTAGTVTINYYASSDSTTPTEGYTTTDNFGASFDEIDYGWTHTHVSQPAMYVDNAGVSLSGFLGPYSQPVLLGAAGGTDSALGFESFSVIRNLLAGDTSEFTTAADEAAVNAVTALLNNGFLEVHTGPQPGVDGGLTGIRLARLFFGNPAFQPATSSGGIITAVANAIGGDPSAIAGTAGYCALLKSDGVTVVATGSVGTSGADLNLSTIVFAGGNSVSCSGFSLTQSQS